VGAVRVNARMEYQEDVIFMRTTEVMELLDCVKAESGARMADALTVIQTLTDRV
jgi:hypothetical protein